MPATHATNDHSLADLQRLDSLADHTSRRSSIPTSVETPTNTNTKAEDHDQR